MNELSGSHAANLALALCSVDPIRPSRGLDFYWETLTKVDLERSADPDKNSGIRLREPELTGQKGGWRSPVPALDRPDHISGFGSKLFIIRADAPTTVPLQVDAFPAQDTPDRMYAGAEPLRQCRSIPMRHAGRRGQKG